MARGHLKLKSTEAVLAAYIVAPIAGLLAFWLLGFGYEIVSGHFALARQVILLPWLLMVGGFICIVVEIVFVTPLLIAFNRYRW